jgi:hypothetical protein
MSEFQGYHWFQGYHSIGQPSKLRGNYHNLETEILLTQSYTNLQAEAIPQRFYGQQQIYRLTRQTLSLAIVRRDNRLKMSYFLGSNRCVLTVWGSRDLASGLNRWSVAHQSSFLLTITDSELHYKLQL